MKRLTQRANAFALKEVVDKELEVDVDQLPQLGRRLPVAVLPRREEQRRRVEAEQ